MKHSPTLFLRALGSAVLAAHAAAAQSDPLDILYVAEPQPQHAERRAAFVEFLDERFGTVRVVDHGEVDADALDGIEVVVLDWHQGDGSDADPLGPRASWTKPTVLVGSAGLLLAMKWEVLGGSG